MRLRLLVLAALALLCTPSLADDAAADCHRLAGSPLDPNRIGDGTAFDQIDIEAASAACESALAATPDDPQLLFEMGRVRTAAGDDAAAFALYREAGEAGYGPAQTNVGVAYEHGLGVEIDLTAALAWYARAADSGDASGFYALGIVYRDGIGTERSPILAVSNFREAATRGHRQALHDLGLVIFHQSESSENYGVALQMFEMADKAGVAGATYMLGYMAEFGVGMEADPVLGMAHYLRAAARGDANAM